MGSQTWWRKCYLEILLMAKLNETFEPVNVTYELGLLVFAPIEALCGELGPVLMGLFCEASFYRL